MDKDLEKDFALLLADYKEDSISDEDLNRLRVMLKENEELRDYYIREQSLDAMMHSELEQTLPEEILVESSSPEPVKGKFSVVYAIAALLVLGFIISLLYMNGTAGEQPVMAFIEETGSSVKVWRNGKELNISDLDGLLNGDKIVTGDQGASLRYANEETTILLEKTSEAVFQIVNGAKVIYLHGGDIICDVDKQPIGKPMRILTPHAEATVLGTQFFLSAGKDSSKIHVNEGAVEFKDKITNKTFKTKAGWTARISKKAGFKKFKHTVNRDLIKVHHFTLINADTNKPFPGYDPIPEGAVIKLSDLGTNRINMLANVDLSPRYVGAVRFIMDARSFSGKRIKIYDPRGRLRNNCTEPIFPFMFGGDTDDEPVVARPWKAVPGDYKLKVIPFGDKETNGISGEPVYLNFKIIK